MNTVYCMFILRKSEGFSNMECCNTSHVKHCFKISLKTGHRKRLETIFCRPVASGLHVALVGDKFEYCADCCTIVGTNLQSSGLT